MHKRFLLAALKQAWLGRGACAPNPAVGAVAVQHGEIIAQASHHGAGTPHAEVLLLAQFPKHTPDVTVYVTLEPCNHWGRTPPCVDAIIEHGIKQVVYAYADPNPVVSANNTPFLLQQQGITVLNHTLPEITEFYQSYHQWTLTQMPWVRAKIAQSFDGKIAHALGERAYLSNSLCAEFTHQQRLHSDVILTSARTINLDNPLLNARTETQQVKKPVAIIDSHFSLQSDAQVLHEASCCHVYFDQQHPLGHQHANCCYYPMPAQSGQLDLKAVIQHLGRLGFHDVWVEAGGELFNALHQAGLVNQSYVYLVPQILGRASIAAYGDSDIFQRAHQLNWLEMGNNMIAQFDWQEAPCLPD